MDEEQVRLYLHGQLEGVFPDISLYYRPPGNLPISRPCIVYEPKKFDPTYANNLAYLVGTTFQVTLLSDLPGYPNPKNIFLMSGVKVEAARTFTHEDIVNDVFTVSVNSIT